MSEIGLFADPIIKAKQLMTLRGPYSLQLILRKYTGKSVYSEQRVLQILIRAGGGAGTGVSTSACPTFNKEKIETLIPILEEATKVALENSITHGIHTGNPNAYSYLLVELFWLISVFFEKTLFKASLPIEDGAKEFEVEIVHNTWRNILYCVIRSRWTFYWAMPALMNCTQFEIFKDGVVQMAEEL